MSIKDFIDIGQSLLTLLRNAALAALVVGVLVWPGQIATLLRGLGIQEFELFGLKGKTVLVDLEQQLRDQKAVNAELGRQLGRSEELLKAVQAGQLPPNGDTTAPSSSSRPTTPGRVPSTDSGATSPAAPVDVAARLKELVEQNTEKTSQVLARADATRQATQATLDTAASAVTVAQSAVGASGLWGIVFGADTTEKAAQPELDRVRTLNLGQPRLYLRQNWYRGVLTFSSQSEAQARLPSVQSLGRTFRDAYVVNLATWCPTPESRSETLWECKK